MRIPIFENSHHELCQPVSRRLELPMPSKWPNSKSGLVVVDSGCRHSAQLGMFSKVKSKGIYIDVETLEKYCGMYI